MKGDDKKLVKFLYRGSKLVIPVYQRKYSWGIAQCKKLYEDLIKTFKEGRQSHFFGAIVTSENDEGIKEDLVIDGQQRLTTISLLLLAIYNNIRDRKLETLDNKLADRIYNDFLADQYTDDIDKKLMLKLTEDDDYAYKALYTNSKNIENSNITINYRYFYDRIKKEEISIDELYSAFEVLEIIDVELKSDDDPQLIFESLNSTGLALEEGDKVRNFILMGASFKNQNILYNNYWKLIENNVGDQMDRFIRDYLSAKTRITPAFKRIYESFKSYVLENNFDKKCLLEDIYLYSTYYNILLTANIDSAIGEVIKRLNKLETTVTRPFFLEILKAMDTDKLKESEAYQVFKTIESYIFRRTIVELPTNSLNKIFLTLFNEVYKLEENYEDFNNKLNYVLLRKSFSGRFPSEDEFLEKLSTRPIFQMKNSALAYILERIENRGSKETKDIYKHIERGEYSIEHIMPQTLSSDWKKELGENYEEIHDLWIHRLANLTLTAYNSEYSNLKFHKKKTIDNGYIDSGLRMNQYIARFDKWDVESLEKRNSDLMKLAIEIWPNIDTDFNTSIGEDIIELSLEDEIDLTGFEIISYTYGDDDEIKAVNWARTYVAILKKLFNEDSSIMVNIATDKSETSLSKIISFNGENFRSAEEISDGLYAELNFSTANKIGNLRKIFDYYNIEYSKLSFKVAKTYN